MRKIFLLILLALGFNAAHAQWTIINGKQRFVLGMGIPTRDTTSTYGVADSSQIVLRPQDSAVYYKYKGHWRILSSKDITTFPWDSITGKPIDFVYGTGNSATIPIWTSSNSLANSIMTQSGGRIKIDNASSVNSELKINSPFGNSSLISLDANGINKWIIAKDLGENFQILRYDSGSFKGSSLYIDNKTGNVSISFNGDSAYKLFVNGKVKVQDTLKSKSFVKTGGTATQYLMADGSITTGIDTNSYFKRNTAITGFLPQQGVITNTDSLVGAISKLAGNTYDVASTGLYQFGGITLGVSPGYSIGPAKGFIVYNSVNVDSPKIIKVDYPGNFYLGDPYLNTTTETYLYLDSTSTLRFSPTPLTAEQRRKNIFIGKLGHPDKATYINAFNQPDIIQSPTSQLRDVWTPLNLINDGVYPSANGANLNINTSAGKLYGLGIGFTSNPLNPSSITITGQAPATFQYRTQTGGANTDVTAIDPANYDNAGTITAIGGGAGSATNQRVFMLQNGKIRIQYGQTVYNSLSSAIAGLQSETFTVFPNFKDNAILIGVLSVVKTATNLSDPTKAQFLLVSKFGETVGSAGGVGTTTLQQAYNNSSIPQIVTSTASGALAIKRGSANATDSVLVVQSSTNGTVFKVTGEGKATAANFIKSGGTSSQYLLADGSVTTGIDTTSLSNRINTKLNIDDTTAMLLPYKTSYPRQAISLTTTGTSGAATYNSSTGVLNVPNYAVNTGTVTSIATTAPLTGGTITTSGTLGITQATTSTNGYLSSTDWNTFNGKQNALTNPVTGTGTANYVSKFTGASTLGNSQIFDNGTSVGVNTTTTASAYKFEVNGIARAITGLIVGNEQGSYVQAGAHKAQIVATGTQTPLLVTGGSGSFEIWKDLTPTQAVAIGMATPGNAITNDFIVSAFNGSAWNKRMQLVNAGRLLLGTFTDDGTNTLQVTGSGKFSGNLTTGGAFFADNGTYILESGITANDGYIQSYKKSDASANNLRFYTGATERMRITSGGNQIIGSPFTDDGVNKLQVNGSAKITSLAGTGERVVTADANGKLQVSTTAATVTSGTYVPTATYPTNATSIGCYTSPYTRIGNVVTMNVSGYFTSTTANTYTKFNLDIPVAAISVGSAVLSGTGNISNSGATQLGAARVTATTGATLGFLIESYPATGGVVQYFSASIQYTLQ